MFSVQPCMFYYHAMYDLHLESFVRANVRFECRCTQAESNALGHACGLTRIFFLCVELPKDGPTTRSRLY